MYIITDKIRLVNIVEREILDYFERSEKGRGNPSTTDKNIHLSSFIIHHSSFIIYHSLKPVGAGVPDCPRKTQ